MTGQDKDAKGESRPCRSCGVSNASCLATVAELGHTCCQDCHDDDSHPMFTRNDFGGSHPSHNTGSQPA